jgi:hypothetical protein
LNYIAATKLCNDQKQIMKRFCDYTEHHWPSQRLNSELAESRYAAFVDPTGFWHALFKVEFKRFIDFLEAQDTNNCNDRVRH